VGANKLGLRVMRVWTAETHMGCDEDMSLELAHVEVNDYLLGLRGSVLLQE
jgi:hypothetical protein